MLSNRQRSNTLEIESRQLPQEEQDRRQRLALALEAIGEDARARSGSYQNETLVPEGGE